MRSLLLKIANKIYKKYAYMDIKQGAGFIYKTDIYTVNRIELKEEPLCLDELIVTLYKNVKLVIT